MIAITVRKRSVLKLVHPGGFAEIHKSPVTADEVMKKNPRHCVTRPDVFKFPWIVVRPESILNIGNVFYIVPFHTIHRLLRRIRCPFENNTRVLEQQLMDSSPVELTYFHELVNVKCPKASPRRSKVDCKIDDLPEDEMFPKRLIQDDPCLDPCQCEDRELLFKSQFQLKLEKFDDSSKKQCFDDHWSTGFTNEDCQDASPQKTCDIFVPHRPLSSSDSALDDVDTNWTYRKDDDGLQSNNYQNENKVIKSCLKKESNGKSRRFKVKFMIPSENNVKQALKLQEKFP